MTAATFSASVSRTGGLLILRSTDVSIPDGYDTVGLELSDRPCGCPVCRTGRVVHPVVLIGPMTNSRLDGWLWSRCRVSLRRVRNGGTR